jgi:hypothetical protein
LALFLFGCQSVFSQDVEDLINQARGLKEKAKQTINDTLKITGNISAQTEINYIKGIPRRSDPFSYQLNGALNFSIYGLSVPLSLNFANKRAIYNYSLPEVKLPSYSFAGTSPSYKWATLHLGDRSMTFSPYTLSGHGFRGFGTELKPGKISFSAMYGRLQRAEAKDLNSLQAIDPLYKRMAWGFKAGYDTGTEHIYAILFKGSDDIHSLPLEENQEIPGPADNTTVSIQGKKQLTKMISLSVDYALSAFTEDQRMDKIKGSAGFKSMFGLFQPHVNSEYINAIKTSLGLKVKWGDLSLNHERVEPGYRTLGALFFNNDFENMTIGTNANLLDKKLMLSSNFGLERNNLSGTLENTSLRLVGSLNASVLLNERLNINASYSNFKNTSKQSALLQPEVLIDSIILSQVNQSASLAASYICGADKNSTFSALFSLNQANSIENDEVQKDQATANYTANFAHSYIFPSKLTFTTAVIGNWNLSSVQTISSYSSTVNIKMPFWEGKLNTSSTFSYILLYTNKLYTSSIINWQPGINYIYKEKHNFGLTLSLIHQKVKSTSESENPSFLETFGRLNYTWSF